MIRHAGMARSAYALTVNDCNQSSCCELEPMFARHTSPPSPLRFSLGLRIVFFFIGKLVPTTSVIRIAGRAKRRVRKDDRASQPRMGRSLWEVLAYMGDPYATGERPSCLGLGLILALC